MKAFKLVSFDLDYTLLNSGHELNEGHIPYLQRISEHHTLVLASGRPLEAMLPIAGRIGPGVVDYFISNNGTLCVDAKGRPFFEKSLASDIAWQVVQTAFAHGVHPHFYKGARIIGFYESPFLRRDEKVTKLKVEIVKDAEAAVLSSKIHKLIVMGEPRKMARFFSAIELLPGINPILAKPYFMEIPPIGIHKGHSLKILSRLLDIRMKDVLAAGDSFNDVEMLAYAGLGLAVANAAQGVKATADYTLTINCDQNLAEVVYGILDPAKRKQWLDRYAYKFKE